MASNIRGITVQINGDVTPLNKALQTVDNSTKKVQNELKSVERLLKFDPGNVELLAQKQQLLTNAIDNTSERLQTLKNSQAEVQAQFDRGEIGADQFRAFQREIIATEGQLDSFRNQLNRLNADVDIDIDSSDVQQAESALKRLGDRALDTADKAKEIGKTLSSTVTPAVTGLGVAATLAAGQFDNANARIQSALGVSAEETQRLGDIAQEVWSNGFGEDLNEVTNGLIRVRQNIKSVNEQDLAQVTTNALALANIFDSDVNEVTRAANNLITNFGLSSEEAFDLLARGAQEGLNFSNELFDNVAEYAPLFASAGFSSKQYFDILKNGAQEGVYNLDYLNDVVKEFNIRIKDGSKSTDEALSNLSEETRNLFTEFENGNATTSDLFYQIISDLKQMDNQILATQLGVSLFGVKFEDLENTAVYALGNVEGGLTNVEGATKRIIEAQEDSFGARFSQLLRTAQESLEPLGLIILDLAEKLLPSIISVLEKVATVFSNLSEPVQLLIVGFGAFVAVLGPLLMVIGSVISAIVKIGGVIGTLIGWVTKVVKILATFRYAIIAIGGPIAIAIGIITGLISIGIALYKNWDSVSKNVVKAFNFIKTGISNAGKAISSTVSSLTTTVVNYFKEKLNATTLLQVGKDLVQGLANGITNAIQAVKDAAASLSQSAIDKVKELFKIKSPSRVMMELGGFAGQGLAVGLQRSSNQVEIAASNVSKVVVNATRKNIDSINKLESDANKERLKIQNKYASDLAKLKKNDNKGRINLEKKLNEDLKKINDKLAKDVSAKQKSLQEEQLKAINDYIDKKKKANQLSLIQESAYLRESYRQFKTGTDARIELENKYQDSVRAINEALTKNNQDYLARAKKIDDDLIANIEKANEDYDKAYNDRYNTLKGYYGLLSEVDIDEVSAEALTKNLRDQTYSLREYSNILDNLRNRGIGDALYQELKGLGPQALGSLRALNNLTDSELDNYVALFNDKLKAIQDITDKELAPLQQITKDNIDFLTDSATVELANLNQEWQKSIVDLVGGTEKNLTTLNQVGKNAAQQLLDGLTSLNSELVTVSRELAESISQTINRSLNLGNFSSIPSAAINLNNAAQNAGSVLGSSVNRNSQQNAQQQIVVQQQAQDLSGLVNAVLQLANNQPDVKLVVDGKELASVVSRNQYNTTALTGLVKGMTI